MSETVLSWLAVDVWTKFSVVCGAFGMMAFIFSLIRIGTLTFDRPESEKWERKYLILLMLCILVVFIFWPSDRMFREFLEYRYGVLK